MLTLDRLHFTMMATETGPAPRRAVRLQQLDPSPLAPAFTMQRFKDGQFIDESVAAGVAH
jgi:hypothetical protein